METNSKMRVGLKVIQPSIGENMLSGDRRSSEAFQKKRRVSSAKKRKSSFAVFEDDSNKKFKDQSTNTEDTGVGSKLKDIEADLCSDEPSKEYWKELAETRREALESTLKENEQLHGQIASLTVKVTKLEEEAVKYEELAERAEELANTIQFLTENTETEDTEESHSSPV